VTADRGVARAAALLVLAACASGPEPSGGAARDAGDVPVACCAELERGVLRELNAARTNPRAFASRLESRLPHYRGSLLQRPEDRVAIRTVEGAAAVREAVSALRGTSPRVALARSEGMSRGARDHARDQARGATGHTGSDGSTMGVRMNRYGRWTGRLTESISYGPATAHDVVAELLIDDAVPDRGHRRNLLDPDVRVAGIACGGHRTYRIVCVIDLAAGFEEGRGE
jgi:uncharacterized protein YkwD